MGDDRKTNGTKGDRRVPNWVAWMAWVLAILFVCMLIGVVVAYISFATLERQNEALLGGCRRLQIERSRLNVTEARIHEVLRKADMEAYERELSTTFWSPPADCDQAVEDPAHFRQPKVIRFSELPSDFPKRILDAAAAKQPPPTP